MSTIEITSLRTLHASMKEENLESTKFVYSVRKDVVFDVFFNVSISPYVLIFGLKGIEPKVIFIDVFPGYKVDTILNHEQYKLFSSILKIDGSSFKPFRFKNFLEAFNNSIPRNAQRHLYYELTEYLTNRNDIDEAQKIYFLGFKNNAVGNKVSEKNYKKNCLAFNCIIANNLKDRNISTCWTSNRELSKDIVAEYDRCVR